MASNFDMLMDVDLATRMWGEGNGNPPTPRNKGATHTIYTNI